MKITTIKQITVQTIFYFFSDFPVKNCEKHPQFAKITPSHRKIFFRSINSLHIIFKKTCIKKYVVWKNNLHLQLENRNSI
jgi:hypothetical protein